MKILKIVIIIFVVILGVFLIPPLFMPSELYVEKSQLMKASPEVIWDQVNCLENWEQWDTWHQDTNMEGRYEGAACGVGAINIWKYKKMDDGGSQTIVESKEYEYIKTNLEFQRSGTAESEMFFEKTEEGTLVTWNLKADAPYPTMRWISALMIKPGVTKAYVDGLNNLNELTKEMKPKPKYSASEAGIKEVSSTNALAIRSTATMEEMGSVMGDAFGKLMQIGGAKMAGPPFAIWYEWEGETFEFDNCIPVTEKIPGNKEVKPIMTYGGKVASLVHTGDYSTTYHSWEILQKYVEDNNLEFNGEPYEVYLSDPGSEPDSNKWLTELCWPVK